MDRDDPQHKHKIESHVVNSGVRVVHVWDGTNVRFEVFEPDVATHLARHQFQRIVQKRRKGDETYVVELASLKVPLPIAEAQASMLSVIDTAEVARRHSDPLERF